MAELKALCMKCRDANNKPTMQVMTNPKVEEKNNNKWMVNSIGLAINKAFIFLFFGDKNTSWEYLTFSSNVDRVKETFSNLNKLKSKVEKEFEKDISEKKLFLAELDTRIREEELKELFDDRLKLGTE